MHCRNRESRMTWPEAPDAAPIDARARRAARPVICYSTERLPAAAWTLYAAARKELTCDFEIVVPPREGRCFRVSAGCFFRIRCIAGPQVGDLNLWNAADLSERFYSGKTRALHGTHLAPGDRMWSCLPYLRPMATITHDTLDWYGFDDFGGSVHDVIGTRCDPYTHRLLSGGTYHHCCHSNLTRALAAETGLSLARGRAARPRRAQRLHVLRLYPRHGPLFHEGQPRPGWRLPGILRRDRPLGSALDVPRRRLLGRAFLRRLPLLSTADRDHAARARRTRGRGRRRHRMPTTGVTDCHDRRFRPRPAPSSSAAASSAARWPITWASWAGPTCCCWSRAS